MRNKSSKAWWLKTTIHLFNVASSQLKVSWSRLGSEELLYYSVCFLCFSFDQWVSRACVFHRDSRVSREKKNKSVRARKAILSCTVHMVQISPAQSLGCIWLFVIPCPWNPPGKNTGVGGLSLLQERSSQPRDQTQVSRIARGFFPSWATREARCTKRE